LVEHEPAPVQLRARARFVRRDSCRPAIVGSKPKPVDAAFRFPDASVQQAAQLGEIARARGGSGTTT
jgi:hypothetical protein